MTDTPVSVTSQQDSTNASPLVVLDRVVVAFGKDVVFNGFSLALQKGRHLALTGPNGSGKSTLLRLIAADLRLSQIPPSGHGSTGTIHWHFGGLHTSSALEAKEHTRLVSPAMQAEYCRRGWKATAEATILSGLDNTALLYFKPDEEQQRKVRQLAKESGVSHLLPCTLPALSQGQLRAMLILRALLAEPALLLLDEPFEGLDLEARQSMSRLVALAAERTTLVLTVHRKKDVPACIVHSVALQRSKASSGMAQIREGISLSSGLTSPSPEPVSGGVENLSEASSPNAMTSQEDCKTQSRLVPPPLPPEVRDMFQNRASDIWVASAPLVALHNVDVYIDRQQVLFGLNWRIEKGQHWVVRGKNGAGKSTLLRLLYGEEFVAFGGKIQWFGQPVMPRASLRLSVGMISDQLQHTYMYNELAKDVVASGIESSIGLYTTPTPQQEKAIAFWMHRLGVASFAETPFHHLSSGQGRLTLLARSLVNAPPMLLLDEALAGLDPANRALWLELLPLLAECGTHLVLVTHHEEEVPAFFTHELVLGEGKIQRASQR